jgi:hypothetical protein
VSDRIRRIVDLPYVHFLMLDELACILEGLAAAIRKTAVLVSVNLIQKQGRVGVPRQVPLDARLLGLTN